MPGIDQAARAVRLSTPLAENALVLSRLDGTEALGTAFDYRLECVSEDHAIELYDLLGQPLGVEFEVHDGGARHLHGVVCSAAHIGRRSEYALYALTLRPWLWLLTRTSDCRIFTDLSVPDILVTVFGDNGHDDYELRLNGTYDVWHHCVQYRETDFAFVSRLMEHEGIYYFVEHAAGKHVLVLCDGPSSHDAAPGYERVPLYAAEERRERDHLVDWHFERHIQPGRYAVNDFAFDEPRRNLLAASTLTSTDAYPAFELYDYPGGYSNRDDGGLERAYGERLARLRAERLVAAHELASARGSARGLAAGRLFELYNCDREDQNREYLLVLARLSITMDSYFSGEGGGTVELCVGIECTSSRQTYRPARATPKSLIEGPQTAIVVGPAGEEIWTDRHGRVKLQFHWDRYGASDENSSCWVRVSQAWAGEKWGAIHVPRIGQEVIVEFVDGDPDRPIVTGRVYNGDRPVPYDLPANKTQSGIKSRSADGGTPSDFNEIRMEDRKGAEELYVHAQKDQNNVVENDETTSVGHDRSESVGNDETIEIGNNRSESVGVDETIAIGSNRGETVGANETIEIGGSRSVTIGVNKFETIAVDKAESIGIAKQLTIGGTYTVTVGQAVTETFGATQNTRVAADHGESVGGDQSLSVGGAQSVSVGKARRDSVGDDMTLSVGKNLSVTAADSISLVTGSASITMKKDGTITIKGKDITVNGKGVIKINASKDIVMKGKKILQN